MENPKAGSKMRWESDAAVKEGFSPHQHVCCPVALLPGKKPLLGSFPHLMESFFLTPKLNPLFSSCVKIVDHSSITRPGLQLAPEQQHVAAAPAAVGRCSLGLGGTHSACGAAGGVEGR